MRTQNLIANSSSPYSFQGQEHDNEIKGEGNSVNYKYRMHDPRIGRFFAVDPLAAKYPHWTPYAFSGNQVIHMVELEGLEPAQNPVTDDTDSRAAKADVLSIASDCKRYESIENIASEGDELKGKQDCWEVEGTYEKPVSWRTFVTDTQKSSANKYNMWVHNSGAFTVDESNAGDFTNYETFVVNEILQNFINGTGPENYIFPTDGVISNAMKESPIVADALNAFNANPEGLNGKPVQYSFGASEFATNLLLNGGNPFNIAGLVGSGTITITSNEYGVYVEIFNITSLSSGAYLAKIPVIPFETPESYVRNSYETTPFGNISQTFSLYLPWNK